MKKTPSQNKHVAANALTGQAAKRALRTSKKLQNNKALSQQLMKPSKADINRSVSVSSNWKANYGKDTDHEGEVGDGDALRRSLDHGFHQMRSSYMHHHSVNHHNWEKPGRGVGRYLIKNLWDVCCNETETEVKDLDMILKKFGLPSVNYSKMKMYDITDYDRAPDMETCKVKDFLDFYVFPYLLPAIQALIQFARVNRVFQCRFCTFNALDYIVEYLYNNNPRHPERLNNPIPLFEIPFCKEWLEKHPRKPPPKWMLMSSEEAAVIIQRAVRGWMVRMRPDVQEMRQFWREIRKDLEEERMILAFGRTLQDSPPSTQYYEEFSGEVEDSLQHQHQILSNREESPSPDVSHHSDNCAYCCAFRNFIDTLPEEVIKSYARRPSIENLSTGRGSDSSNVQKTNSAGGTLVSRPGTFDLGEADGGGGTELDENILLSTAGNTAPASSKRASNAQPTQPNEAIPSHSNSKSIKAKANTQNQKSIVQSPVNKTGKMKGGKKQDG